MSLAVGSFPKIQTCSRHFTSK